MKHTLSRFIFLITVIPFLLISLGCANSSYDAASRPDNHPGLKPGEPRGYAEFWAATWFGMWMQDLEEGPSTTDCWLIEVLHGDGGAAQYPRAQRAMIGRMQQLAAPFGNLDLQYRRIANNFSGTRVAMPIGDQEIVLSYPCVEPTPHQFATISIEEGRVTVVRLDIRNENDWLNIYYWQGPRTLPVSAEWNSFNPNRDAFQEYLAFLKSRDWGMAGTGQGDWG